MQIPYHTLIERLSTVLELLRAAGQDTTRATALLSLPCSDKDLGDVLREYKAVASTDAPDDLVDVVGGRLITLARFRQDVPGGLAIHTRYLALGVLRQTPEDDRPKLIDIDQEKGLMGELAREYGHQENGQHALRPEQEEIVREAWSATVNEQQELCGVETHLRMSARLPQIEHLLRAYNRPVGLARSLVSVLPSDADLFEGLTLLRDTPDDELLEAMGEWLCNLARASGAEGADAALEIHARRIFVGYAGCSHEWNGRFESSAQDELGRLYGTAPNERCWPRLNEEQARRARVAWNDAAEEQYQIDPRYLEKRIRAWEEDPCYDLNVHARTCAEYRALTQYEADRGRVRALQRSAKKADKRRIKREAQARAAERDCSTFDEAATQIEHAAWAAVRAVAQAQATK